MGSRFWVQCCPDIELGGYMKDETMGQEDAAQDAEACAEALESLDRISLDDVAFDETFVDMQDETREDALADTEQSASEDAEADGAGDDDTGSNGTDPDDDAEGTDNAPIDDADATIQPEPEANNQPSPDHGEETTLLGNLPADDSLTRELPGLGSAPAVDETIAMGDIPLPSVPSAREAEVRHRKMSPKRRNLMVAGVVAVALVAGGAGYAAWNGYRQEQAAVVAANAHTMMSVQIGVHAAGLDCSTGSKIPVQVSGQDSDGSSVSETLYVDEHGRGIKLLPGDYTLSIAASPIAADGTIYTVPTTKAQVTVKSDGQDLCTQASFKLKVPSADTVSDDQIDAAAKYAEEGGVNSAAVAKVLQQAATARRDAAVNAVSSRKAQAARDADARHKATDLYQLDIPVEWYGKVATWQNGSTLCIYLAGDTSTPLVTLVTVRDGESFTPDEGDAVLGAANLGNGYTVYASGPVYPYVIPQTINGRTQNPVSTYPMDTAIELVELTTGNRYTYSQIKNVLVGKDGNADAATKLETDYLAQILLPSIKAQD
jgi:hypothetical protein